MNSHIQNIRIRKGRALPTIPIITIIVIFSFPMILHAQCWDFESDEVNFTCSGTTQNAFAKGCVQSWRRLYGTPDVYPTSSTASNHYANFYGVVPTSNGSTQGEGIFIGCGFENGKQYTMSFKLKTHPRDEETFDYVSFILTNNGTDSENSYYIKNPTTQWQSIQIIYPEVSTDWVEYSFTFTANYNYNELWIRPWWNENDKRDYFQCDLFMDDICVYGCDYDKLYNNLSTALPTGLTSVNHQITATNSNIVQSNEPETTFRAGDNIYLQSGFYSESGSNFHALIGPCAQGLYCFPFSFDREGTKDTTTEQGSKYTPVPPLELQLANYPNPFTNTTQILYSLPYDAEVEISVFNMYGQKIKQLVNHELSKKGSYTLDFSSSELPPGVYHCTLITELGRLTIPMLIIR